MIWNLIGTIGGKVLDIVDDVDGFQTPSLPDGEMPTDELIEFMTSRYNKRVAAKDAQDRYSAASPFFA